MRDDSNIGWLLLLGIGLLALSGTASAAMFWPSAAGTGPAATGDNALPDSVDPASLVSSTAPDASTVDTSGSSTMSSSASLDSKISAFLATIRQFESGGDYSILYGGTHFTDFSHHPNVRVPIKIGKYAGQVSTAAGAYQINFPTYNQFAPTLGISDFSAASQDAIAYAILQTTGAFDYLNADDVEGAMRAASSKWASLPYSTAGQHPQSLQVALDTYTSNLG